MVAAPRARWSELALLVPAATVALSAAASLGAAAAAAGEPGPADGAAGGVLGPAVLLVGMFLAAHLALVWRRPAADQVVLPVALCLMGLSQAAIRFLAPGFFGRLVVWQAIGVAALLAAALAPGVLRLLRRYRYTWAVAALALVAVTLVAGRSGAPGGPRLWLGVGPLVFQPSELLKLLLVAFLAAYLEDKRELLADARTRIGPLRLPPLPYLAPLALMLGLALALLAAQRDLGAALLLYAIGLGMLYLASSRVAYVAAGLALFAAGAWALHGRLGIVQQRVAIWRDPWSDAQNLGYQLVQSLQAVAAGGLTGTGLGAGQPDTIPAAFTDVVYSALVEQIGLAGSAAVLALYAVLVLRGLRIAVRARDSFARLLAAGLSLTLALQTFLIVGGVLRVVPLTGITLPLLSYGGSSILVTAFSIGLLLRIGDAAPGPR